MTNPTFIENTFQERGEFPFYNVMNHKVMDVLQISFAMKKSSIFVYSIFFYAAFLVKVLFPVK